MSRDHLGNFMVSSNLGFARGILLLDDCEGTFTWIATGTGGDDIHAFATVAAFLGLNGMHLRTRVTNPAADDVVSVAKYFGYPEGGLIVLRLRLSSPDWSKVKRIGVGLNLDDGIRVYDPYVVLHPVTHRVEYHDALGNEVQAVAFDCTLQNNGWFTLELAISALDKDYVALAFNGTRVDLSAVALHDAGASAGRCAWCWIDVLAQGANAATAYFDNIYVGEFLDL